MSLLHHWTPQPHCSCWSVLTPLTAARSLCPTTPSPEVSGSFNKDKGQVLELVQWPWLAVQLSKLAQGIGFSPMFGQRFKSQRVARVAKTREEIALLRSKGGSKFQPSFCQGRLSVMSVMALLLSPGTGLPSRGGCCYPPCRTCRALSNIWSSCCRDVLAQNATAHKPVYFVLEWSYGQRNDQKCTQSG